MLYDLRQALDRERFKARANALYAKDAIVELTEKAGRTGRQNSYLHLLIGVVAMDTGVTLEYAKREYFKRLVNADLFVCEVEDRYRGRIEVLRSSASLTKEQMVTAIDRFKRWGTENGFYMPEAHDADILRDIEISMRRMEQYL
jgi:hypothetical protein